MDRFFTTHYKQIVKMTEKITQSPEYEEIAHYIMEQFMEHPRRDELIKKGQAMKFMSGMIWRNWNSSTSPYFKLYRQNRKIFPYDPNHFLDSSQSRDDHEGDFDQLENHNMSGGDTLRTRLQQDMPEDYDIEKDLKLSAIEGILEDMQAEGIHTWYIATLFQMWVDVPNFSELSRQTLIPRTSIAAAVEEAKQYIRKRLEENGFID